MAFNIAYCEADARQIDIILYIWYLVCDIFQRYRLVRSLQQEKGQ